MNRTRTFLTALAALAMLPMAACETRSGSPAVAVPAPQREVSLSRRALPLPLRRDAHPVASQVGKTKSPLLFVSDAGTGEVYLFNLTTLALSGTITGFVQPQGECAASKGDVWIADTGAQTVYEVTHEGQLAGELAIKGYPVSCAWDPKSGNLAITVMLAPSGASGYVSVYAKATGTPISYYDKHAYYYNFAGYDAGGNLFVDGRNARGAFVLMELAAGSTTLKTLRVKGGKIYFPGMLQWDTSAGDLVVGDQSCKDMYSSCLHTLTLAGATATVKGTITVQNSSGGTVCDLVQGVLYGGQLLGSDYDFCGSLPSTTYVWPYPAGGAPSIYNASTDTAPIGATVSL